MALTVQPEFRAPANSLPRRAILAALFAVTLGGFLLYRGSSRELRAQQAPNLPGQPANAGPETDAAEDGDVFLPSDRTLLRGIATARERISQGEYTQAIRFLNDVLGQEEDSFEASGAQTDPKPATRPNRPQYTGLKETARHMIRNLPPAGRAAYELAYRAHAQRLLQGAIQSGSIDQLARIARQYFYTPAGYEATYLYAQNETDHGRHLAAALAYRQLLDTPEAARRFQPQLSILSALSWLAAGNRSRAEESLIQLKRLEARKPQRAQTIRIAGQRYPLFGPEGLFDDATIASKSAADEFSGSGTPGNGAVDPLVRLCKIVGAPTVTRRPLERQWLTLHGNEARNGQTEGGLPHLCVRWKVRLLGHPKLEALCDTLTAEIAKNGKPSAVAASPLAVGNTIITRSANQLIAVDFKTGKLVWAAGEPHLQSWEQQLRSAAMDPEGQEEIADPTRSFAQRIWEDRLLGVISSDGKRVFAIDHLTSPQPDRIQRWQVRGLPGGGGSQSNLTLPGTTNRLSAYDLKTEGRLVWEVDGQTAKGELQGAFFLGAPLSVGQSIYSLAEIKSAIYLVAMAGSSGQLQWRQKLVSLEASIFMDLTRRLHASMPSYDAGILVCPTGAGVVVGVDLAKRSLAWAYRYDHLQQPQRAFHRLLGETDTGSPGNHEHWVDSSPILAAGRVLLTPPESKYLHCLDLATGKFLWKKKRRPYHTLACVAAVQSHHPAEPDGREMVLLLLGNRQATALQLRDGNPAWDRTVLSFPRGVQPAGTGFQSHGRYYLPLTSTEVIAIDLAQGTIASRTSSRDGQVLGNLICHQGTVLSQSGRSLDRFDQVEVLRKRAAERLAVDPNHVESLRVLGEIAYNGRQLDKAIRLLLRAHRLAPDDVLTGEVLSGCLMTALDEDFAGYREYLGLLSKLIAGSSSNRLQLLRIQADGLLSLGELLKSFEVCLQIFQEANDPEEMLSIGGRRQVQVARWVQAQTDVIWAAASKAERATLRQRMAAVLPAPGAATTRSGATVGAGTSGLPAPGMIHKDVLQRCLQFFGGLPQNRPWWLQRARMLLADGHLLAAQQILLRLSPLPHESGPVRDSGASESPPGDSPYEAAENSAQIPRIENEATALLAQLLHQAGRHHLARPWDQRLEGPLADVICLRNEHDTWTGAQCVSRWRTPQQPPGPMLDKLPAARWPYGKVDVTTAQVSARRSVYAPQWGIRLEHTDSVLGSCTLLMSSRKKELTARNSLGQDFFSAKLPLDGQQAIQYRTPGYTYGVSRGNLLVVSLGTQLIAFNTLASSDNSKSAHLWHSPPRRDFDSAYAHAGYRAERSTSESARLGSYRAPRWSIGSKWMGVIGPVTADACVYQDQRGLICCNPLTGKVVWSRTDVPTGSDLFGDHQYLFVAPRTGGIAYVFRMTDGKRLDQVTIPRWKQRLATLGRQILRWRETTTTPGTSRQENSRPEGGLELSCVDALSGDEAWHYEFQKQARIDIARGRYVAVVEPSGQCTILDAHSGDTLVRDSLRPDPMLSEIHLRVASDHFTLLTNHLTPKQNTNRVRGLIPRDCPLITGQVASFDRATGAPRWNQPAEIKQQALMLTQPGDLPILLFVNFTQRRNNRGSRPGLSMLVLEMASGRTLYRADNLPNTGGSHLVVRMTKVPSPGVPAADKRTHGKLSDPDSGQPPRAPGAAALARHPLHEVAIEMTACVVRLNFTGAPRPPQPPAMAEVEVLGPASSKGLLGIFKKLGGGS